MVNVPEKRNSFFFTGKTLSMDIVIINWFRLPMRFFGIMKFIKDRSRFLSLLFVGIASNVAK